MNKQCTPTSSVVGAIATFTFILTFQVIIFISFRLHKHHFKQKMVIPKKFFAAKWITAKVHGEPAIVSKDEILKNLVLIICKEFSVL